MKRIVFKCAHSVITIVLLTILGTSCIHHGLYNSELVKELTEKSFDFKTTYEAPIQVMYDKQVYFRLYENEPTTEMIEEPFYSAYTDANGKLKSTMEIPKYLKGKTVYAYTDNICVRNLAEVTINEEGINADLTFAAMPVTKANAIDEGEIKAIPGAVINRIESTLPELKDNRKKIQYTNTNINVEENCSIKLTFIHEHTKAKNALHYFFYRTKDYDQINQETKAKYLGADSEFYGYGGVVFPNAEYPILKSGQTVKLQFNGSDTIPAGVSVGWYIKQPGVNTTFYSIKSLNLPKGQSQTIAFRDEETQQIIFGFEDWNKGDWDMNDILFSVEANPFKAIDNPDFPPLDDPTEETLKSEEKSGTLLFEDLYPKQGDYDMNDAVIGYKLTKHFSKENLLRNLEVEIIPKHDGAYYTNGFAFMIDDFDYNEITINDKPASLDAGGAVLVYHKNKNVLKDTFRIKITPKNLNTGKDALKWSAFNPFIFVGDRAEGIEVHLTKRASSSIANKNRVDELVSQYISNKNPGNKAMQWPFAMNIPTNYFRIAKETVRIDIAYPKFEDWVKGYSDNSNYNNKWWEYPDKQYVE